MVAAKGGGGAGAAAFAAGGANSIIGQEQEGQAAQEADIAAELDKSEARLDKSRNRLSTMFNTNPDAFVNPDGTPVIDEKILGWYLTGTQIPIFPQTRRLLTQRDARWSQRMDLLTDALGNATDPSDRRNLTRAWANQAQWFDIPDEVVESVVNAQDPADFNNALYGHMLRYGRETGLAAVVWAGENGFGNNLQHPEVQKRVEYKTDTNDDFLPSQLKQKRGLDDLDIINQYTRSPINAEFIRKTREANPEQVATRIIREQALSSIGEEEVNWYESWVNSQNPQQFRRYNDAYDQISSELTLAETVRGAQGLKNTLDMTDEEFQVLKQELTAERVGASEDGARRSAETQRLQRENDAAGTIQREFPKMEINNIYKIVSEVGDYAEIKARKEDGTIDAIMYGRFFDAALAKTIEENQDTKKE